MASTGEEETARLRHNVEEQLNRLLQQLEDLEELKAELDEDEYNETKADTLQQLQEFEGALQRMTEGNITLVDELSSVRMAIRAAVRQAFRTPEVIKLFAKKQPAQLRHRLARLKRDHDLGKLSTEAYEPQAVETLLALQKLGEELSAEEAHLLQVHRSHTGEFEEASADLGKASADRMLSVAGSAITSAQRDADSK